MGKAEASRNRILEILAADRAKHPGGRMSSLQIAHKTGLHHDTVRTYLVGLWRAGRVLRMKIGMRQYAYRCVLEGEALERFRCAEVEPFQWSAFPG